MTGVLPKRTETRLILFFEVSTKFYLGRYRLSDRRSDVEPGPLENIKSFRSLETSS